MGRVGFLGQRWCTDFATGSGRLVPGPAGREEGSGAWSVAWEVAVWVGTGARPGGRLLPAAACWVTWCHQDAQRGRVWASKGMAGSAGAAASCLPAHAARPPLTSITVRLGEKLCRGGTRLW